MISSIAIQGFKSFRNLNPFQLRPLNVLIGPNRSGKTNFLDFLHLLSEAGRQKLPPAINKRGGVGDVISWSEEQKLAWGLAFEFDVENAPANETGIYYVAEIVKKHFSFSVSKETFGPKESFDISKENFTWTVRHPSTNYDQSQRELAIFASDSNGVSAHDTFSQIGYQLDNSNLIISQLRDSANFPISARLRHELTNITVHRFFDTTPDAPIRNTQPLGMFDADLPPTRLSQGGNNLTNVLYYMQNQPEYQDYYDEYLLTLQRAFPSLENLVFPADLGQGKTILAWKDFEFPKRAITANLLSDGTLRFMCLLAALYDPNPPSLLCIDEPEVGLHPQLVRLLVSVLQEASERMQIIVATHSADLISYLQNADDVVVVEAENGWSTLKRLEQKKLEHWLKDYSLGELWKSGEIGGRL